MRAGIARFGESDLHLCRGFDPEHPLAEDLKRKDFIALAPVSQSFLTRPDLVNGFLSMCAAGGPFLRFLCGALDVPF